MSKFNTGDMVRIVHSDYIHCGLEVGTVHKVVSATDTGVYLWGCYHNGRRDELYFFNEEVELIGKPTNNLTVGQPYTSKNGHKWLCIAVDGEYAYMRADDDPASSAYCFKTDGTNISQGGDDWDVKFGPDRRTINVQGSFVLDDIYDVPMTYHHTLGEHVFNMTIDMVDGKPDWSSAKLTGV